MKSPSDLKKALEKASSLFAEAVANQPSTVMGTEVDSSDANNSAEDEAPCDDFDNEAVGEDE